MLSLLGPNPYLSLQLIHSLDLTSAIFCPPIDPAPSIPWTDVLTAINIVKYWFTSPSPSLRMLFKSSDEQYRAWLSAALIPWRGLLETNGSKPVTYAAVALRDGLKAPKKDYNFFITVDNHKRDILDLLGKNKNLGGLTRVDIGQALLRWGTTWHAQLSCVVMMQLVDVWGAGSEPTTEAQVLLDQYELFVQRVGECDLDKVHLLKPLFNV